MVRLFSFCIQFGCVTYTAKMQKNILAFSLVFLANVSDSARILGMIPTPSYSHQVVFHPFWKELSLRGHEVTVLTTNPINDPTLTNLTEINTNFSYKILTDKLLEIIDASFFEGLKLTFKVFSDVVDCQLDHPPVKQLLTDSNVKFDLVIAEYLIAPAMALSKKFSCPYIGLSTVDPPNSVHRLLGNPAHPILYPDMMLGEDGNLTFLKRLTAVFLDALIIVFWLLIATPEQEKLFKKHFGQIYDSGELAGSASLVFVNTDPVFHTVRPLNPNVIQIGGRLMRLPSKPLSKDLQVLLYSDKNGFIYFSLGSNVNSKDIPEKTMSVILETFQDLPYTILWKYELDHLPNKPDNVVISKWLPQLEVLKHPNLKLFITHGGAQSFEEGVSARVPMLGMPFFADQPYNIKKMVKRGFGLSVNYKTLEKEHFKQTIFEMINNPIYRQRTQKLAELAEDQPITGLELALWWTEYVLRHNGTTNLKNSIFSIPWYQYYFLDIIGTLLLIFIALICLGILAFKQIRKILRCIMSSRKKIKEQ